MRVPIPHSLPNEEVRHRLKSRSSEIVNFIPGGMADVTTSWPDDDTMLMTIAAMGKTVTGTVALEPGQLVFTVNLPGSMSFIEPMVRGALEQKGRKLLA